MITSTSLKNDLIRAKILGGMRKAITHRNSDNVNKSVAIIKNQKGKPSIAIIRNATNKGHAFSIFEIVNGFSFRDITNLIYSGALR